MPDSRTPSVAQGRQACLDGSEQVELQVAVPCNVTVSRTDLQ